MERGNEAWNGACAMSPCMFVLVLLSAEGLVQQSQDLVDVQRNVFEIECGDVLLTLESNKQQTSAGISTLPARDDDWEITFSSRSSILRSISSTLR